jgi:hypothetical protein
VRKRLGIWLEARVERLWGRHAARAVAFAVFWRSNS